MQVRLLSTCDLAPSLYAALDSKNYSTASKKTFGDEDITASLKVKVKLKVIHHCAEFLSNKNPKF